MTVLRLKRRVMRRMRVGEDWLRGLRDQILWQMLTALRLRRRVMRRMRVDEGG